MLIIFTEIDVYALPSAYFLQWNHYAFDTNISGNTGKSKSISRFTTDENDCYNLSGLQRQTHMTKYSARLYPAVPLQLEVYSHKYTRYQKSVKWHLSHISTCHGFT